MFRTCTYYQSGNCLQMKGQKCDHTLKTEKKCTAYFSALEELTIKK